MQSPKQQVVVSLKIIGNSKCAFDKNFCPFFFWQIQDVVHPTVICRFFKKFLLYSCKPQLTFPAVYPPAKNEKRKKSGSGCIIA